jgi:MSHA pilin protein MshD
MCNKRAAGFTLVEMIIAIVIISVGLAGVLTAFNITVKSSADPMIRKQMLSIAEEMMEEILLKPHAVSPGTISGCDRHLADDLFDYGSGYTAQPVCDIEGGAVVGLSGYTVSVSLQAENLTSTAPVSAPAIRVTVTVNYGTTETLSLVGWRTDYAS